MFKIQCIKLYTDDFIGKLRLNDEIDTEGTKQIVLAFQQGRDFDKRRDIWFMMVHAKNHAGSGHGQTLISNSLQTVYDKLNPVDGVEFFGHSTIWTNPGFLGSFGVCDLLNTIRFLYDCLDEMGGTRRNVTMMNRAFECKRSDTWKKWFGSIISVLASFTNSRISRLEQFGESVRIDGLFRFDRLVGDEFRNAELKRSVFRSCRVPPVSHEWRISGGFVEHRDRMTGEVDYLFCLAERSEFFRPVAEDAGVAPVCTQAGKILGVAVPETVAGAYGMIRQAIYEVVGSESQNGREYLKVVNDNGEEIWINREKATSTITG